MTNDDGEKKTPAFGGKESEPLPQKSQSIEVSERISSATSLDDLKLKILTLPSSLVEASKVNEVIQGIQNKISEQLTEGAEYGSLLLADFSDDELLLMADKVVQVAGIRRVVIHFLFEIRERAEDLAKVTHFRVFNVLVALLRLSEHGVTFKVVRSGQTSDRPPDKIKLKIEKLITEFNEKQSQSEKSAYLNKAILDVSKIANLQYKLFLFLRDEAGIVPYEQLPQNDEFKRRYAKYLAQTKK